MRKRNKLGQFIIPNQNENQTPVMSLFNYFWTAINYFVLFILYLPWIITFLSVSYFIISYIDFRGMFDSFMENHVCKCKIKLNNGL